MAQYVHDLTIIFFSRYYFQTNSLLSISKVIVILQKAYRNIQRWNFFFIKVEIVFLNDQKMAAPLFQPSFWAINLMEF